MDDHRVVNMIDVLTSSRVGLMMLTAAILPVVILACDIPHETNEPICPEPECALASDCEAKHGPLSACEQWACYGQQVCAVEKLACGSLCALPDNSVGECHGGACHSLPECKLSDDCIAKHGGAPQCNDWDCQSNSCVLRSSYENSVCSLPMGEIGYCDAGACVEPQQCASQPSCFSWSSYTKFGTPCTVDSDCPKDANPCMSAFCNQDGICTSGVMGSGLPGACPDGYWCTPMGDDAKCCNTPPQCVSFGFGNGCNSVDTCESKGFPGRTCTEGACCL